MSWPQFDPEAIAIALFNQLQKANGPNPGQYAFNSTDRRGQEPENVPSANQPYLGLIERGFSQVENQAQGLEKWLLHFMVLVYIRADATPETIWATELNNAMKAIVSVMRSSPIGERQTLGGIVDNAWIEGQIWMGGGVLDPQSFMVIPIVVDCGI